MDTHTKNYKFLFDSDSSDYVELINDKGYKLYDYYDDNDNDNDNDNEYQYNPTSSKNIYVRPVPVPRQSYNNRSPTLPSHSLNYSYPNRGGYYNNDDIIWDDNIEYYKTNKTCNAVKYCFYQACEFCLFVKDKVITCAEYIKSKCIKEKYDNCENYENYGNESIFFVHENPIKKERKVNMRTPLNKSELSV